MMPDLGPSGAANGFEVWLQHWGTHKAGEPIPHCSKEWFPTREAAYARKVELRQQYQNPASLICVMPARSLKLRVRKGRMTMREHALSISDHAKQGGPTMPEYDTELDPGAGDLGPWLTWHAAPSRDGSQQPGTWSVRDAAGRATVNLSAGFVFDWPVAKTGWMHTTGVPGVAPEKRWNASRGKFDKSPGDDWKRALWVPVAYTPTARAVWEQASAAAWMGFVDLWALLTEAKAKLPMLPLLTYSGHKQVKLGQGVTLVPQFRLSRYVPRPACLPDEDAAPVQAVTGDAWGAVQPAKPNGQAMDNVAVRQPPGAIEGPTWDTMKPGGWGASTPGGLVDDEIPF